MKTKRGRGRDYRIKPLDGFRNGDAAFAAAYLDELRERVYDQIVDLPQEALDYVPASGRVEVGVAGIDPAGARSESGTAEAAPILTIGRLGLHLSWGEMSWIGRVSGSEVPADLKSKLKTGSLELFATAPEEAPSADRIITLGRRVREEVTIPHLRSVGEIDLPVLQDGSTLRGVLMHLQWHWIFHCGHIGLIRQEWGSNYKWTFDRPLAPVPR